MKDLRKYHLALTAQVEVTADGPLTDEQLIAIGREIGAGHTPWQLDIPVEVNVKARPLLPPEAEIVVSVTRRPKAAGPDLTVVPETH